MVDGLDTKVMLLNNQHLGMVVQWEDRFYKANRAHTYLGRRESEWHETLVSTSTRSTHCLVLSHCTADARQQLAWTPERWQQCSICCPALAAVSVRAPLF